jgi:predicted Zn-dependent protease
MGAQYLIDHIITAYNAEQEHKAYRIYVTDIMKALAEANGADVMCRYADLIEVGRHEEMDADAIALDVIQRAGLRLNDEFNNTESDSWT